MHETPMVHDAHVPSIRGPLRGVRVLVVDDSETNREVVKHLLESDGGRVTLACSGQQAIEMLQGSPTAFDAVVMDVHMPHLDGYDSTRRIHDELGLVELPIIGMSAGTHRGERQYAEAAGMTDFIGKPFAAPSLSQILVRHVRPLHNTGVAAPTPDTRSVQDAPAGVDVMRQDEATWPEIVGIDASDARSRWCGDVSLFTRMLSRLFDEFEDVGLPVAFNDSTVIDPYIHRMHTLRGGASMLGAKGVNELAGEIEEACVNRDHDRAAGASIRLGIELRRIRASAQPPRIPVNAAPVH